MSERTDEQLAELFQQTLRQANEAFWILHERHAPRLLSFLQRRANRPSEAEDVHQEIWLRVWRTLPEQFHGGQFRAWLFRVARNCHVDWERKHRHAQQEVAYQENQPLPSEYDRPAVGKVSKEENWQEQQQQALRHCLEELQTLNPQANEVFQSRLAGQEYDEICQRMNLDSAKAYKLCNEAKQHLRQCTERILQ